jgi:VWFA-related protein
MPGRGWIVKCTRYAFVVAAFLAVLLLPSTGTANSIGSEAQRPESTGNSAPQTTGVTPYTFKADATLVNLDVLVTDEDGRVLSGLKAGNFRVLDNGIPQKILNFSPVSQPITIVMLVEYSAASYNYFALKAAWWGSQFLDHLDERDWVALVTYDMRTKVQVDFTHNRYQIRDALTNLGYPQFRETNLFDALVDTLEKLDGVSGRKSILLMATGTNSMSEANLDEVFNRLKQSDVTVFCVGLAEAEYVRYGGSDISYVQAKTWLNTFAQQTGGIALFPRFEGELPDIFRSVVGFLRNEYTLSFRPPRESRDGRYHRLKVELVGADGKPLKVTNDKGRRRKVEVYAREGYTAPKDVTPQQSADQ